MISIPIIKWNTIIETIPITTLLVTAASETEMVTSPADKGANNKSTIVPSIFLRRKEDEECEKDCWSTCIESNPGAKKVIKGTPSTSPLAAPIAKEKKRKNNKDEWFVFVDVM